MKNTNDVDGDLKLWNGSDYYYCAGLYPVVLLYRVRATTRWSLCRCFVDGMFEALLITLLSTMMSTGTYVFVCSM